MIASIIRCGINALDGMAELAEDDQMITESVQEHPQGLQHITVGLSLPVTTLAELEQEHRDDAA